ncbi:NAD-dependent epimerase/dehydratase family protein [Actinotignum urinale]|uniref:NAD-dependent epimerase/dehydratase family protein n=1 Tax=Actinotignum urinale TaxID=190146 RepID=UPI002A82A7D0|nr:NAD-dependent epimerase/dehydratase family protein [Actinotignum urinale]MDY5150904.1 NAD-dependent epimerase/dehydratase family protein [Actinotignum urinale]
MDFLIFGGNGFIGSHLVDSLRSRGHDVSVFDLFDGSRTHWEAKDVTCISGNFLNIAEVASALHGHTNVVHLLSLTDPATSQADPTVDIRANLLSSVTLFQACVQANVKHVYFASSGGTVYGVQEDKQFFKETDPTYPISPYGIGKLSIEHYLDYFRTSHGLNSTIFRISNPYGTRQNPNKRQGIIPIFLQNILHNKPLTIMGDGSMTRDYIYVQDLAKLMAHAMTTDNPHHVYNLGSGTSTSVNDIVHAITDVVGYSPVCEHIPAPASYVPHVGLDISRWITDFGEMSLKPLHEGIQATWNEISSHVA